VFGYAAGASGQLSSIDAGGGRGTRRVRMNESEIGTGPETFG